MNTDIREHWHLPLRATRCPKCAVAHLIPENMERALCPACFSAQLEPQPNLLRSESPELVLDFNIHPVFTKLKINDWIQGVWFRPDELDPEILFSRLTKTFFPMWLVDCNVSGTWEAQMGYDYQVASSQEIYQSGRWITQEVTETRIRWEPRSGQIERSYQNLDVPALEEHNSLKNEIGDYQWGSVKKYSPSILENASVRIPSLLPEAAWVYAKSGFDRIAEKDCQDAANAQHVEQFVIQAQYRHVNWTQLLLPLFTTAYRDDRGRVIPVSINGQNGKIYGLKRASQRKAWRCTGILGVCALLVIALGVGFFLGLPLHPILGVLGTIIFLFGLVLGIVSPIPALWAWNFNRKPRT